ncbi:helix-turn-helix domain-containing protein [Actinacidiphila alni]|uniref:helix-turn-helix transcriptional regulator n=1 Tax=Actinacidiphila alni TaxID=380248 RepID=UPI0034097F37
MTKPTGPADPSPDGTDAPTGRRREVLDALRRSAAPLSIAGIARDLGVHPNTVRFHLDTLVGQGLAEQVGAVRTGPGRPPLMFRARPGMDPAGPRNYRLLASILLGELAQRRSPGRAAVAAGRAWGERLAGPPHGPASGPTPGPLTEDRTVRALLRLLDEWGFAPEHPAPGGADRIGLRHCPFLDLAEGRPDVVCPVHLGLIQGALTTMNGALSADRLEPFVEPGLCVIHLGRTTAALEEAAH